MAKRKAEHVCLVCKKVVVTEEGATRCPECGAFSPRKMDVNKVVNDPDSTPEETRIAAFHLLGVECDCRPGRVCSECESYNKNRLAWLLRHGVRLRRERAISITGAAIARALRRVASVFKRKGPKS